MARLQIGFPAWDVESVWLDGDRLEVKASRPGTGGHRQILIAPTPAELEVALFEAEERRSGARRSQPWRQPR
jgi:hypothetical protein